MSTRAICDVCHHLGLSGDPLFKVNEFNLAKNEATLLDLHRRCIGTRMVDRVNCIYQRLIEAPKTQEGVDNAK